MEWTRVLDIVRQAETLLEEIRGDPPDGSSGALSAEMHDAIAASLGSLLLVAHHVDAVGVGARGPRPGREAEWDLAKIKSAPDLEVKVERVPGVRTMHTLTSVKLDKRVVVTAWYDGRPREVATSSIDGGPSDYIRGKV